MKTQVFRCAVVSTVCLAWAIGMLGCGKGDSTDAGARGGNGGGAGTGASSTASGGTAGTGGATSTGGTASGTGGGNTNIGGSSLGTGGWTTGGGGATAAGGGGANDGGASDVPAIRNDGSPKPDVSSDVPQGKDSGPETGSGKNDVALGDTPSAGDSGITIPPGYKLVWSDEFDVDGAPNPKNWNYEKGFARNEELQWYQPDNATVAGGLLVIEARKERVANPNYQSGSSDWKTSRQYAEYTSTSMTTSGLQSWQYGRLEMRARIPTSAGMWPAWWTLGVSGEWPSNGEIDIMEYYKGNVLANVACGTSTRWQAKWDSSTKAISSLGSSWASSFHTWRMDWDDQKIDLYLDDTLMNSVTLSSMLNSDGTSPFKQKVTMLVNLALGGTNGGDPSGTTFPQRYEVDWIRVFQKQ
jgi:beta-glucanase (GH16 family)